jgi:muconate cycloisomerase
MIARLAEYNIEFVEQPTPRNSLDALLSVHDSVCVAIAADQSVFTAEEVFEVCRRRAAALIVLGIHQAGGLINLRQAAAVAKAGGLNICLHGGFETGISTCASNHVGATIANLDDGNQIMWQLLEADLIAKPRLEPTNGSLPVLGGPGLGFELDSDAVESASRAFQVAFPD